MPLSWGLCMLDKVSAPSSRCPVACPSVACITIVCEEFACPLLPQMLVPSYSVSPAGGTLEQGCAFPEVGVQGRTLWAGMGSQMHNRTGGKEKCVDESVHTVLQRTQTKLVTLFTE